MGGFFGVVSRGESVSDLFYGTDYHSHLGTQRGGMAVLGGEGFKRFIHDIRNTQFRTKFSEDVHQLRGPAGIGVISDYEDQPLLIASHLGPYAIVTVGLVANMDSLVRKAFGKGTAMGTGLCCATMANQTFFSHLMKCARCCTRIA